MRVNDPSLTGTSASQTTGPGRTQGAVKVTSGRSATAKGRENSTDQVSLSELSERLRATDTDSAERAAELERLALEVREKRYQADAKEVSRRLVDDHLVE